MYAYVTVETLKSSGGLNIPNGTGADVRLRQLAEAVTQEFDRVLHRRIHPSVGTMYYSGDGSTLLLTDDLVAISSLKEDNTDDGTFDTTWAAADYNYLPYNVDPTSDVGRPYHGLEVNPKSNGNQDAFLQGRRNYQITGTWGWSSVTVTADAVCSANVTVGDVTLDIGTVNSATKIETGMVLSVNSEQMYVESLVGSSTGTSVRVSRAANGSTAGSHGSGDAINYYTHPSPIREGAFVQTARLWKRKDSGFSSEVGFPETGQITTFRGTMDADVKMLIGPYMKRFV